MRPHTRAMLAVLLFAFAAVANAALLWMEHQLHRRV